jgi:hypothetical protein
MGKRTAQVWPTWRDSKAREKGLPLSFFVNWINPFSVGELEIEKALET